MEFLIDIARILFHKLFFTPLINEEIAEADPVALKKAKQGDPMTGDEESCRCPHEDCHFTNDRVLDGLGVRAYEQPSVVRACFHCGRLVLYLTEWRSGAAIIRAYKYCRPS